MAEVNQISDTTTPNVGEINFPIVIDLGVDITSATGEVLYVVKPDGTEVTWTPTIYNTNYLRYLTVDGDLNIAGTYKVQPYIVHDSVTGRRKDGEFKVWARV